MKSFQLLRTNPLLTTNYKINVDTGLNIYLESIKSNADLSDSRFNHFQINRDSYLETTLPTFYKGLPKEQAFYVRNEQDKDIVYNDYSHQFDDIYYGGPSYISDTWYDEEFEYFAPLFVRKNELPDGFIILRVDDPSVYNEVDGLYELGTLDKENFRSEIINKWKSVSYFDMTKNSDFGYWLDRNIDENERFPTRSFELDVRRVTFSRWYGMDYETGVYTQKPMFLDDNLFYEQPHFRLEKIITEGYKRNSLIFPHIFNFNFLFEDTPATPEELRKYSINRYLGFYVDDLEFVTNLTSYVTPTLVSGTTLLNNIVLSGFTGMTWDECERDFDKIIPSVNPFIGKWDKDKRYYIYVKDDLYEVIRFVDEDNNTIFKLVSEEILDDYWDTSKVYDKTVEIVYTGGTYSYLVPMVDDFTIDEYTGCTGHNMDMYSDLYLIKINDRFHVIRNGSGLTLTDIDDNLIGVVDKYFIQSDYAIESDKDNLRYWIGGNNSEYYREYDIENINRKPLTYSIYKVTFLDVKDFDFDRVNTKFSDFDYEKTRYYETKEDKLYAIDHKSNMYPKPIMKEEIGDEFQCKPIAVSSEYVADDELYETTIDGDITDIWSKNQSICKWGFQGSVSHSDYMYKLNNSKDVGSTHNKTTDVFTTYPNIYNKNMDYFYRVGNFLSGLTLVSSAPVYYLNQTTNIQMEFINKEVSEGSEFTQNGGNGFNIGIYFETTTPEDFDFDYFTFFFSNKMYIEDDNRLYQHSYKKYSEFYNNEYNQSVTLFKGLKFLITEVVDIKRDDNGLITKIISDDTGKYSGYKFSIILNDVYYKGEAPDGLYKVNGIIEYDGVVDISGDGIHIIINDIYKNIVIIINVRIILPINSNGETFNFVSLFGEKDGLYDNKYRDGRVASSDFNNRKIVASNFINAINDVNSMYGFDNYIKYYHIKKDGSSSVYDSGFISGLNDTIDPPIVLSIETPDVIKIKNKSYKKEVVESPNISKLFSKDELGKQMIRTDDVLSVNIIKNDKIEPTKDIYRYSGSYEPIFKDVHLFGDSIFCYVGYYIDWGSPISGNTTVSGFTARNYDPGFGGWEGTIYDDDPPGKGTKWEGLDRFVNDDPPDPYVNVTVFRTDGGSPIHTYRLLVNGFDFSQIPSNAEILGMELTIERKSQFRTGSTVTPLTMPIPMMFGIGNSEKDNIITFGGPFGPGPFGLTDLLLGWKFTDGTWQVTDSSKVTIQSVDRFRTLGDNEGVGKQSFLELDKDYILYISGTTAADYIEIYNGTTSSPTITPDLNGDFATSVNLMSPRINGNFYIMNRATLGGTGWKVTSNVRMELYEMEDTQPSPVDGFDSEPTSMSEIHLSWNNGTGGGVGNTRMVIIAWTDDGVFGTLSDGTTPPHVGDTISGGGEVIFNGYETLLEFDHESLSGCTDYYYMSWVYYKEDSSYDYSDTSETDTTTYCFDFPEPPSNLEAASEQAYRLDISWDLNSNGDDILLSWTSDGVFGEPITGVSYISGDTISGGGNVIYVGNSTSFIHSSLPSSTLYYYKAWSISGTTSGDIYSLDGVETSKYTLGEPGEQEQWTKDFEIALIGDINDNSTIGENLAYTDVYWETDHTRVTYNDLDNVWPGRPNNYWTPSIIRSSNFGVAIRCDVINNWGYAPDKNQDYLPSIKSITIGIKYNYWKGEQMYTDSVYFKKNQKFDNSLHNFGSIDEIIYSKVNINNESILKISDAKYPIIDQFGYSYNDRFIFKSDWDKSFYLNTIDKFVDDSTRYYIPSTKTVDPDRKI